MKYRIGRGNERRVDLQPLFLSAGEMISLLYILRIPLWKEEE